MTRRLLPITPIHFKGLAGLLILFHVGVGSVVADDVPIWSPLPDIGCNVAGQDLTSEIITPLNNASYYLNQTVNFTCNRSFDIDTLIVGGSTSYPADAMTNNPSYPYWTSYPGSFPNGNSGTSVTWRAPSTPAVVNIALVVSTTFRTFCLRESLGTGCSC